jgi:hypothetical protein
MSQATRPRRAAGRAVAAIAGSLALAGCNLFNTDVKNPTAVEESSLSNPAAAATLANGLGSSVTRAHAAVFGAMGTVTDELTWIGSREYYNLLDGGDITDPLNEYFNDNGWPFVAEARWLANYTIRRLEQFDADGTIRNRTDLARAYLYGATIYNMIGEFYDDFVISSDRQTGGEPVGHTNMRVMFDSAAAFLTRAEAIPGISADLRRQILGLRARVRHSAAVWALVRANRSAAPANPLVNNAQANADATAALAAMPADYRYRINTTPQNRPGINIGFEMNQRLEIRAGSEIINPDGTGLRPLAGLAGIKLQDPVSGQPDATVARAIDECCRAASGIDIPFTITSAAEMNLILAEAALATNNIPEFQARINAARAVNGKPAWTPSSSVSARDLLIHERRVHLFLSGRRLSDLYRFGRKADRWLPTSIAFRMNCFVPIAFLERQTNPKAIEPGGNNTSRPSYCQ